MARRKYSSGEIIHKPHVADVPAGRGKTVHEACARLLLPDLPRWDWP
jgi:hypothetical protein